MKPSLSLLAHAQGASTNPVDGSDTKAQDLETLLDCFSDIDTEFDHPESNRIAYVVQLLQMRDMRHLSETQKTGRRFLLDMLGVLSLSLHPQRQSETAELVLTGYDPTCRLKYLAFLLERTAQPSLAASVRQAHSWRVIDPQIVVEVRLWLDRHGWDLSELAMLQPVLFRSDNSLMGSESRLHPHFAALQQETSERTDDYFAQAFLGISKTIELTPNVAASAPIGTARGEAVASVFDTPFDQKAATSTRLKAFFIPNRFGEPVIALSFMNEY